MPAPVLSLPFELSKLVDICRANDVQRISIFGSVARGEDRPDSDIDLLVEFQKRKSLLSLVALERKLAEALGREVDLLTEAAISPYLRPSIQRDLRVLYEAR